MKSYPGYNNRKKEKKEKKRRETRHVQTATNQCTNKQLVPVYQNQTNESSPTEQIVILTEHAPYQHQPYRLTANKNSQ